MQLVDTNVIGEIARPKPNAGVLAWAEGLTFLALSAVTVEEISLGLAWRPQPRVREWFDEFLENQCDVLPITPAIAQRSGQLRGTLASRGSTRTQADMLIAATAQIHQMTLVTRNVRDFEGISIGLLNPFS